MILRAALPAALALFASLTTHAQTPATGDGGRNTTAAVKKPARDFVMLQATHERWSGTPDSVNITGVGRGFNAYLCYDFPIKRSPLSFAVGVGVGTSNIYLDDQELRLTEEGQTEVIFADETLEYKRYKISTAYLEAPFELRYFANRENRNRGFKAAVGLRAGTLLSAGTKGVYDFSGAKVTEKERTRRYFENWRVAGTLRLGWGNFSLLGTYNLNPLFRENNGPVITPYSVGICVTGL